MSKSRWEYIYGMNPAFEAVRGGRRTIHGALLNSASAQMPRMKKLADLLQRNGIDVEWVDKGRIFDFAQNKDHQGVVLRTSPYRYVPFADLLDRPRLLLLDNIEDPHNAGAIIRCADCFGFHAVLLPLKGTPEVYPSVVKVSAGATEHLDIARDANANQYVKRALEEGYKIIALDAKGDALLSEVELGADEKWMLVIGGEARSVGQFILNEAHIVARIDQFGKINSLNASVAAGVAMYELRRRLR